MTSLDPTDLELLEIQIDAWFTHDPEGRIVSTKEPGGGPAPRFFLGRTGEGNLWRVRHDVPPDTARQLVELARNEPVHDDLRAAPGNLDAMMDALRKDHEPLEDSGPAYRFPDDLPAPANVTRITRANLDLLRRIVPDMDDLERDFEQCEPSTAIVVDGAAVADCYSSCLTMRAAEAGVVTLDDYRGRGYASAVVAAWAHILRDSGRIPLYSTTWDNLASQGVARKLGLIQYAADLWLE